MKTASTWGCLLFLRTESFVSSTTQRKDSSFWGTGCGPTVYSHCIEDQNWHWKLPLKTRSNDLMFGMTWFGSNYRAPMATLYETLDLWNIYGNHWKPDVDPIRVLAAVNFCPGTCFFWMIEYDVLLWPPKKCWHWKLWKLCGTGRKAYVDGLKHDITLRKLISNIFWWSLICCSMTAGISRNIWWHDMLLGAGNCYSTGSRAWEGPGHGDVRHFSPGAMEGSRWPSVRWFLPWLLYIMSVMSKRGQLLNATWMLLINGPW